MKNLYSLFIFVIFAISCVFATLNVPIKQNGVVDVDGFLEGIMKKKDGGFDTLFADSSDSSPNFISKNNAYDISQAASKKSLGFSAPPSHDDSFFDDEQQQDFGGFNPADFNPEDLKAANMDPEALKQYGFDATQYANEDGYGDDQQQDYKLPADADELGSFKFEVFGKVQGVFFRDSASKEAKTLEITGWIANSPSGSVVGEAEGYMPDLREFRTWLCKIGSRASQIDDCKITQENNQLPRRQHAKFIVDYDYQGADGEQTRKPKASSKSKMNLKDEL